MNPETLASGCRIALRTTDVRTKRALRQGGVRIEEYDDIKQELLLACCSAITKFDPNRASLRTFIETVVSTRLTSVHRKRCRHRNVQQLGEEQPRDQSTQIESAEMRIDLARILDRLSPEDRELAVALMEHTPAKASRIVGIARSTAYKRIRRIHEALAAAGFP